MKLEELVNRYSNRLNPTDNMIWKYIYNNKELCCKYTIYELAEICNVSRTTILRFAKKLSLDGYSDLKAILKQESESIGTKECNQIQKVCKLYDRIIKEASNKDFLRICELIYNSKRIFAYGTGSVQNNVITEMKRLFLRSGNIIYNVEGTAEKTFLLDSISKGDIVFIISLSGENEHAIHFAKELSLKDIPIISITKLKDNTLASLSTEKIYISTLEIPIYHNSKMQYYESITSYYFIIEMLFLKYLIYKDEIDG